MKTLIVVVALLITDSQQSVLVYVNDELVSEPALVTNGRASLPLRAVAESLGAKVDFDSTKPLITINTRVRPTEEDMMRFLRRRGGSGLILDRSERMDLMFKIKENLIGDTGAGERLQQAYYSWFEDPYSIIETYTFIVHVISAREDGAIRRSYGSMLYNELGSHLTMIARYHEGQR